MKAENKIDVYQELRSRILNETLYPGQKISEVSLAREFNCSRTPIRDVLKRLELDGLVVIKPKSGTYVKVETIKDLIETIQMRTAFERLAYMLSYKNASRRDIAKMEREKREMDRISASEPIDMMKFAQAHYNFHYNLILLSGNDLLLSNFERLNLRSSHMFYKTMDLKLAEETQKEHQMIIDYLKDRSVEGIKFVEEHLQRKIHRLISES